MACIHVRGVGPGRLVGNVLAALKVSALVLFIALGFSIGARIDRQPAVVGWRGGVTRGCWRWCR